MRSEVVFPELTEIEGLRGKIEGWRQSQPKSRSMPEELWQEASTAARRLGAGRVARALGLNYETLKQRVLSNGPDRPGGRVHRKRQPEGTGFIELKGFPALGELAARDEMVVEMVAADGARLTIRINAGSASVPALINVLRGRS
ncbi:MAG: hypothetical protein JWO52_734 [Gammaproteobacteria bacterium]|jgi:hypothetical protein|nr:hypothetical protein [Gammaproteobacteria bacterium]